MKETFEPLKELGAVLTGLSAWSYVAGYLSLHARAHALGTDPAFKLVDEAYVFAGFRIVIISLIVLLLSAPLLLPLDRWLARRMERRSAHLRAGLSWTALAVVAMLTIYSLRIFACAGLLLAEHGEPTCGADLRSAILGGSSALPWIFVWTLLPILCALALRAHLRARSGPLAWLLSIVVALQLCLLPTYHGALFADRKVRVLSTPEDTFHALRTPVGVVEQSEDYATLYGLDASGRRALMSIALSDMHGLPVHRSMPLSEFTRELATREAEIRVKSSHSVHLTDGADRRSPRPSSKSHAPPTSTQSSPVTFLEQVVELLRITFEAIGSLGESPVHAGELWEARINPEGAVVRRRLGVASDLAWPVSEPGGSAVWALRAGQLVRVSSSGDVTAAAHAEPVRWHKLLGVTATGSVLGFLVEGDRAVPATLTSDGAVHRASPKDTPDQAGKLAKLLEESRSYAGKIALTVDRSERGGNGFDVYLTRAGKRTNVSDCGDDSCAQASLADDRQRVLYIRSPRY